MSKFLNKVTSGVVRVPHLIILHGLDGVGKSTFAAKAPGNVFLGPEKGTSNIAGAQRLPQPKNLRDVWEMLNELFTEQHDYKTLTIDSLDWLEPMIWDQVCIENGCNSIEEVGGGFGKGYVAALAYWRKLRDAISKLQDAKGMNFIGICHTEAKTFNDPQTNASYDRYQMTMHAKAAALMRQWAEVVMFATYKTAMKKEGGKLRAFGDGSRVVYTERRPAWDAKNRHNLPFEMPLEWEDYEAAMNAGEPEKVSVIKKNIEELLAMATDADLIAKVKETVTKAGDNAANLAMIQDRLRSKLVKEEETNG